MARSITIDDLIEQGKTKGYAVAGVLLYKKIDDMNYEIIFSPAEVPEKEQLKSVLDEKLGNMEDISWVQ